MSKTPIGPNVTKVAIVYGAKSGLVRRHIYAEHSHDEYFVPGTLLPGEALCLVDVQHHHAGHEAFHQAIRDTVKAHGGVDAILSAHEDASKPYHHVQIDPLSHVVTAHVLADPDIDNVKHGPNHYTLDEMGFVRVPLGRSVAIDHIYDPATGEFRPPFPGTHPSKQKVGDGSK